MDNSLEFASLLCSRLCHDLISPVGSIYNGIELLADEQDPDMRARCLDLLAESARATTHKLRFFRLAFGAAGGFGERVDPREAHAALEGLFGPDGNVRLHWLASDAPLTKPALKVLLNLALIAGDALIRGGDLHVGCEVTDDGTEVAVRAAGPRLILDHELRAALDGQTGPAAATPRAAVACLISAVLAAAGGALIVSEPDEGVLLFGATLPEASLAAEGAALTA